MANNVIRIKSEGVWRALNISSLNDRSLSWKAKGIHDWLRSRPDGWVFTTKGMEAWASDGRESLRSGLDELKDKGYLKLTRLRNFDGSFGDWEWTIYDVPTEGEPLTYAQTHRKKAAATNDRPNDGKPALGQTSPASRDPNEGNQDTGNPSSGEPNDGKPYLGKPVSIETEKVEDTTSPDGEVDDRGRPPLKLTPEEEPSDGNGNGCETHRLMEALVEYGLLGSDVTGNDYGKQAKQLKRLVDREGEDMVLRVLKHGMRSIFPFVNGDPFDAFDVAKYWPKAKAKVNGKGAGHGSDTTGAPGKTGGGTTKGRDSKTAFDFRAKKSGVRRGESAQASGH